MKRVLIFFYVAGIFLTSCQNQKKESQVDMENPFFKEWTTPYGVPPFDEIKIEHYLPALKEGIEQHEAEIDAILANKDEPTFENTILTFDKSGKLLSKVTGTFYPLNSANTNDKMQELAREVAPLMTRHYDNISLNPLLFERIKSIYERRNELGLDKEQMRATEKYYEDFVRGGANLSKENQEKLRALNEELSKLSLQFGENLLAETNRNFKLVIDDKTGLEGLPEDVIARAADDAKAFGEEGKWVFTLAKPSMLPFLQYAKNRDLREKLYRGYFMRGDNDNAFDNKEVIKKIVKLRDEKAKLLGFANHAEFIIDINMAKTPDAVYEFLMQLWNPAMEWQRRT